MDKTLFFGGVLDLVLGCTALALLRGRLFAVAVGFVFIGAGGQSIGMSLGWIT